MFKLNKHKSSKGGEKFDFQFSDFQAIKVPKGWDKLFVSLVSLETGKTIVKSGKTSVRNGICRWTETFHESVSISQEKGDTKELQGCLFRFLVAMGSSRSGILGEITINLSDYASSRTSVPLSLPLKKCNYGTSLQFKIQCLTPKTKYRNAQSEQTNIHVEYGNNDMEISSDASDGAFSRSGASVSANHLQSTSTSQTGLSRDPSLSASDSRHSFDSVEVSSGNDMFSPQNNKLGPVTNLIVRQDSIDSQNSGPSRSFRVTDDDNRSNHSCVPSLAAESFSSYTFQQEERNSNAFVSPPLLNADSSKGLLEDSKVTIEELRKEARMWERSAKTSTIDVDDLKKEMPEQSRSLAALSMELSASQQECNGLKQEIEHLKSSLAESLKKNDATADLRLQAADMDELKKEMEEEIRFQKESNANLTEQLQKTQESNIELLSILQELETIIETQKIEIENLSSQNLKLHVSENQCLPANTQISSNINAESTKVVQPTQDTDEHSSEDIHNLKLELQQLQETQEELKQFIQLLEKSVEEKDGEIERERNLRTQALLDSESNWRLQVAAKEEEIMKLEASLSAAVKYQENKNLEGESEDETDLAREINALRRKVDDLEKECNELTEENLELLLKLKQQNNLLPPVALVGSSCGSHDDNSSCTYGTEVRQLRDQLEKLQLELRSKETLVDHAATFMQSQVQCADYEQKCRELEIELQSYKENAVHLEDELQKFHAGVKEQQIEIEALQQRIEQYEATETKNGDLQLLLSNVNCALSPPNNLSDILLQMRELLDHTLKLTKRHGYSFNFTLDFNSICCFHNLALTCNEPLTCEEQLRVILDSLSKTNECFEGKCDRCRGMFKYAKEDTRDEDHLQEPGSLNHENVISNQGLGKADQVIQPDLGHELAKEASEIKALNSDKWRMEEEIDVLQKQINTLEDQMASIRNENVLLQENIQSLEREKISSSKSLEELKKEIMMLSSSVESQISENKVLERLSSELGKGKEDLEQQLSDLEKENMQLSERISALEAQLRYLTDEKETCLLELRHSESQSMKLRDEINRLEIEIETQKVDVSQKVQDMRNRWLETLEECEYLKKANPKLQSTAENLIEECNSLQKFNGELRRQNMELHTRCTVLESQLRDTQGKFAECSEKIEALEADFLMIVEEVSLKEKSLNSELESLIIEDREHREKVMQENISLNDMYLQKVVEAENLQRELAHLIDQISVSHNERESVASQAILEVSVLRADKAKLEAALQELTSKFALSQSKLGILEAETEAKVQQLTALRKNQDVLVANHDNLLVSLESFRSSEEKYKSVITELEINLKASKYEVLQLKEEISSLKEQLQRATLIEAEVLGLKTSLSEAKFEHERVKASFDLLCEDHKELKAEKDSLVQKISGMQKSLLELDNCQCSKIALEEKILRLEGDLAAREALCAQDAELKFELTKIKRANGELQRKVKHLELDQEECLKKVQVLQELQPKNQAMHGQMTSAGKASDLDDECIPVLSSTRDEKQPLEVPGVQNTDCLSKIQSLENELAEALDANEMYKAQLRRFLSEEQNCSDTPKTPGSDSDLYVKRQGNMSFLEVELRDLRERYFQMSLKYAEVEAQREELVLKLKSVKNRRSWFS